MFFCCDSGPSQQGGVIETPDAAVAPAEQAAAPQPVVKLEAPPVDTVEESPAEKALEPTPGGFCIVFKQGDEEKPRYFQRKPLGFKFLSQVPLVVTNVDAGGHADELGVQVGMEVVAIGGETASGKAYKDLWDKLVAGSATLSPA
eukprot:CAMPEP_0176223130 /NCGR_PEP_ID=MMETSP0121_2-20121125/20588_1 /TAXON_ID=160619 /ORGANISM="Kryptoperidinium foliaceum, Strain CCMP 1326" /LENGTH=144 /DNA_ID=CAMNT_0017562359 /DNA_START=116 /DNA_END=550 /DNA_ORIENTATION=+